MSNFDISVLFFLQLAAVLLACRIVGYIARWLGQPQVVGEMIAGILLGPSLFGHFFPDLFARLFPAQTKPVIYTIAQVGIAFYMFVVGLDFRIGFVKERIRTAASVSVAGIIVPFILGGAIGYAYSGDTRLFSHEAAGLENVLYLGSALSITAFPMLARIIYERGLTGTHLGTLTLAAGSIDDASAWCVLAVVLASFNREPGIAIWAIGGGVAYAIVVLFLARPLLAKLNTLAVRHGGVSAPMLSFTLMLAALGSWFTDWIGIYAVFGGFVLGVAMPRGLYADSVRKMLEPIITAMLVPFFFVWSGLNMHVDLLASAGMWIITAMILAAAIIGKGVACGIAARLNGESTRDSIAIGALMNARGMMELIIANIGLERGIISPTLYSILVLMTLVTTFMATPVFELAIGRKSLPATIERTTRLADSELQA